MLIWVTKMNKVVRMVLINTENVCMVDQYSNEREDGSEIHLRNGSIVRVKEDIQHLYKLMTGRALSFSFTKEKQNSLASKESPQERA